MKITIYLDEQREPEAVAWVNRQHNKSRAIVRLINRQTARDTPLTMSTMRVMVDDVVRTALRDELKHVAVSGIESNDEQHEENAELSSLLDGMEF